MDDSRPRTISPAARCSHALLRAWWPRNTRKMVARAWRWRRSSFRAMCPRKERCMFMAATPCQRMRLRTKKPRTMAWITAAAPYWYRIHRRTRYLGGSKRVDHSRVGTARNTMGELVDAVCNQTDETATRARSPSEDGLQLQQVRDCVDGALTQPAPVPLLPSSTLRLARRRVVRPDRRDLVR